MSRLTKIIFGVAVLITVAALLLWQLTGGDYYTKYEVIEQVEKTLDPNDPLVAAGFYKDSKATETVARKDFRFGLLPTPSGILDKHVASVLSIASPFWLLGLALLFWNRRALARSRS